MTKYDYELIVIGSGPAGEKAAVKAAYFGHKVALIEKAKLFGGAEVVTGTLPSKTLKESALFFSGKYEKGLYGIERDFTREASIQDFMFRKNIITTSEASEIRANLLRHQVDIYEGTASFQDPHSIRIETPSQKTITGQYILIATGSYPYHPSSIPFEGIRVHDSDTILQIKQFPHSLCVLGAGVIGCEYATIFAALGAKVFLINNKEEILPHVDREVARALVAQMRQSGIDILFNESIQEIILPEKDELCSPLKIKVSSGGIIEATMFLFAAGRSGNIGSLNLDKIGIRLGKREQILVDKTYRTNIPHIFAAGDVIGFPALASTSMEQGRVAVSNMFNINDLDNLPSLLPYGIYTIPEVSMIGITQQEAEATQLDYCTGKARYGDLPRGKIMGATSGFLKLVFERESLIVRGVHVIGYIATELVHYGMQIVESKKDLYYLISQVFNYPTLHDLYKYAAYDGLSNLAGHKVKP